jgi:hypothetical protein
MAAGVNPERKTLSQLCWHLGAGQGDSHAISLDFVLYTYEQGTVSCSHFRHIPDAPFHPNT